MTIELTINGTPAKLTVHSTDRLVDVLRGQARIGSLLPDCLAGCCGRCLIFLDGRLVNSCLVPAFKAKGSSIATFESLVKSELLMDIEKGLAAAKAFPCAFCRSGKIMAIADLLSWKSLPDRDDIVEQMKIVSCSCTDTESLVQATLIAADLAGRRKYRRDNK